MWLRQNLPIEVKFCRRNAGDGVPYGDLCRDTPPGVSGPTRPRVGDTRGRVSLHALFRRERLKKHVIARPVGPHPRVASLGPSGQFTFWQSASPVVQSTARSSWDRKEKKSPGCSFSLHPGPCSFSISADHFVHQASFHLVPLVPPFWKRKCWPRASHCLTRGFSSLPPMIQRAPPFSR